jgi:hypothetical protein
MKLRQRIHRRATYNRSKARHRVLMKALIAAADKVVEEIRHQWTFVGPPKPYGSISQVRMDFTFYPHQTGKTITNAVVMEAVKKLSPIVGVIDVSKG